MQYCLKDKKGLLATCEQIIISSFAEQTEQHLKIHIWGRWKGLKIV